MSSVPAAAQLDMRSLQARHGTPSLVNGTPSLVNGTPSLVNGTPSLVNGTPSLVNEKARHGRGGASAAPLSRVSACAARTINATGHSRAALVAAVGALQSGLWPLPGGKEPHTRSPKRSLQRMLVKIGNRITREFPLFLLILKGIFLYYKGLPCPSLLILQGPLRSGCW